MLGVALDEFLEKGFDQASLEGIAAAAGMSKRTIYARYKDKADLFRAAIERAVDRYTIAQEDLLAADAEDLRTTLLNLARLRIANLTQPESIKLQRVLTSQSYLFPELFRQAFERSVAPTMAFLEARLAREAEIGVIDVRNPQQTITAFLSLVVGGPARVMVAGASLETAEIERHLTFTVDLFLNGIRAR